MRKLQSQGVHHLTLVGADRQTSRRLYDLEFCSSLAGIVRAHEAAQETGVRLVVGCRLDLTNGTSLLVYPTGRAAYARLSRLPGLGKS